MYQVYSYIVVKSNSNMIEYDRYCSELFKTFHLAVSVAGKPGVADVSKMSKELKTLSSV